MLVNRITTTIPREFWYPDLTRDDGLFCVYKLDPEDPDLFTQNPSTFVLRIEKTRGKPDARVSLIVTPEPLEEAPPTGVIDGEEVASATLKNDPRLKERGRAWAKKYLKDRRPKDDSDDDDGLYIHPAELEYQSETRIPSDEEVIETVRNLSDLQKDMLLHIHRTVVLEHDNPYCKVTFGEIEEHSAYPEIPHSKAKAANALRTVNALVKKGLVELDKHAPKMGCKMKMCYHTVGLSPVGVWAVDQWAKIFPPLVLDPAQRAENAKLFAAANWPN